MSFETKKKVRKREQATHSKGLELKEIFYRCLLRIRWTEYTSNEEVLSVIETTSKFIRTIRKSNLKFIVAE